MKFDPDKVRKLVSEVLTALERPGDIRLFLKKYGQIIGAEPLMNEP